MDISHRFEIFLRAARVNQKEFAENTGYAQQSLSKFLTGTTKSPRIDLLVALATHYPKLDLRWLLLGEGEMWLSEERQAQQVDAVEIFQRNEILERENRDLRELLKAKEETIRAKDELIDLLRKD